LAKCRINDTFRLEGAVLDKLSLKDGQIFIDIGSYVGTWSVWASKQVGSDGKVVAVEPDPINFKMLLINIKKLKNIIPVNVALWSENTTLNLFMSTYPTMHSLTKNYKRSYIKVKCLTLDSLIKSLNLSEVDALKIDVEGAELEVLKGAKETLKKLKWILVEIHNEKLRKKVSTLLKNESFILYRINHRHVIGLRK